MGVYVLTRRTSVAQPFGPGAAAAAAAGFGSSPRGGSLGRGDRCYTNVTNLSLVHCACHAAASRADRALKQPRSEWDGATLRNQNIRCNNLLPLLGPATPAHMYAQHAERYWGGVAQLGRHEGSHFRMASGPASMSNFVRRSASGFTLLCP